MTSQIKILWVALIAVAIIALAGWFYPAVKETVQKLGGVTNYDELDATAMKIGGANGSRVGPIIAGTCSLLPSNYSFAATTSISVDCAVTGIVTGDEVIGQFATTTSTNGSGSWDIVGASASTTAGFITFNVVNNTGTTAFIPGSVGSTTQYLVLHPRTSVPGL